MVFRVFQTSKIVLSVVQSMQRNKVEEGKKSLKNEKNFKHFSLHGSHIAATTIKVYSYIQRALHSTMIYERSESDGKCSAQSFLRFQSIVFLDNFCVSAVHMCECLYFCPFSLSKNIHIHMHRHSHTSQRGTTAHRIAALQPLFHPIFFPYSQCCILLCASFFGSRAQFVLPFFRLRCVFILFFRFGFGALFYSRCRFFALVAWIVYVCINTSPAMHEKLQAPPRKCLLHSYIFVCTNTI